MSADAFEGKIVDGRFFVRRRLGAGNFGAVYLAEQRVFDVPLRPVALKLFKGALVTPKNAADVLNDAIILIQLQQAPDHAAVAPYLVSVYDAGFLHDQPGQAFVAMEYVEGYRPSPNGRMINTLEGLIRAFQPVPVAMALRWMVQLLRPLAWMHTLPRPALHGDLKPDNVLACGPDRLKVVDFGLAQLASGIVGTSNVSGALSCQAPETLLGVYPTPASDVYSIGLILYEMLAGKNPLTEVGLEASLAKRHDEFRDAQVRARADGLPPLADSDHPELKYHPLLLEILGRCLRFKAQDRYDTAASLLHDVERYAAGEGVNLPKVAEDEAAATEVAVPTLERLMNEVEAMMKQGRLAEARTMCEQAREQYPASGLPYRGLAQLLLAEGRWQEALKQIAAGRKMAPDEPTLCDAAGDAYEAGGQPSAARTWREQALKLRQRARK